MFGTIKKLNPQIPWGILWNMYCVYWRVPPPCFRAWGIYGMASCYYELMYSCMELGECYFTTSLLHHLPHISYFIITSMFIHKWWHHNVDPMSNRWLANGPLLWLSVAEPSTTLDTGKHVFCRGKGNILSLWKWLCTRPLSAARLNSESLHKSQFVPWFFSLHPPG